MNIKFKHIHVNNFFSFGDAEFDINRNNYVLVRGENNNPVDSAQSNGSGKSAIFDAIVWALTGDTTRGTKDVSNIYGDNGAMVEVSFSVDNHEYVVTRYKDHKPEGTTLKIFIDGEDKSGKGIRDTEKLLTEYLPDLTPSVLSSVIILGQGLPQRFSNNTPSGRKEVLEKLSKSDFMIQDLKNRISERKEQLNNLIKDCDLSIASLQGQVSACMLEKDRLCKQLQEYPSAESLHTQINSIESELLAVRNNLNDISQQRCEVNQQYNDLSTALYELISHKATQCDELKTTYSDKLSELRTKIGNKVSEEKLLKQQISQLESITDTCPTCGQKLHGITKPDTSELHQQLNLLEQDLAIDKQTELKLTHELNDKLSEVETLFKTNNEQSLRKQKELQDKLAEYDKQITQLTNSEKKLSVQRESLHTQRELLQSNKLQINTRLSELDKELQEHNNAILYNNNNKESNNSRLSIVNKLNTMVTRDFRGVLLKNVIEFIDTQAKKYSMQVFNNSNINFCLDGNAIEISFDGKEYSNLSGGERQKIDVIIQLSLRDMLCKFLNFSSNIIVLDELFDNLDAVGCDKILSLISKNLSDVETVYIITHHADISIPTDDELIIVKGANKISSIR